MTEGKRVLKRSKNKTTCFRKSVNVILMFVFIYPLQFTFFPLSTRYLLAIVGLILLITNKHLFSKYVSGVLRFVPILFFSVLTCLVNQTSDFGLWTTPIVYSLSFFSAVGVISLTKTNNQESFVDMFVMAVVIQMILHLIFFIFPEIEEMANLVLASTELAQESMESSLGVRMRGLGSAFFGTGVVNSIALILISFFYSPSKKYHIIAYILIIVIGVFASRTTLVGFLISFPLLLRRMRVPFRKVIVGACIFIFGISALATALKNSGEQKYVNLFNFGFAFINDYESSKKFNTEDIDALSYSGRLPDNIKTWIIGDGLLADPQNPATAYYKHVDQGYLRCIFFYGLLGTISLLIGYYLEVNRVVRYNRDKRFYILYFFYLVIMYKGLFDIFQYIIPFYLIKQAKPLES